MKHRIETDKSAKKIIKLSTKLTIAIVPILFIVYVLYSITNAPEPPKGNVTITITPGKNTKQIGEILRKHNVISSVALFRFYASFSGVSDKLVAGDYTFKKNSSIRSVVEELSEGPKIKSFWITIPEGWTSDKIANAANGKGKIRTSEFLRLVKQPWKFKYSNIDKDVTSLEGYLFPNTYKVYEKTNSNQFMEMLLEEYNSNASLLDWSNAEKRKITRNQIIIIASLIEREASIPSERPIIAGVIYNRLEKGMPLQIDASVQYALPKWKSRLTYNDLKIDSPYNTYKNKGLPPGPICNPGKDAIEASLKPANINFLYYVLINKNGRHAFADSYDEFLKLKRNRP